MKGVNRLSTLIPLMLIACGSSRPALSPDVALPGAANAIAGEVSGAPVVSVVGDDVLVDHRVVGNARSIVSTKRLTRIDGLFEALRTSRETWKTAHPGESFPGVIAFAFDADASALIVKNVFQTAAFAGYPNATFLVRMGDRVGTSTWMRRFLVCRRATDLLVRA